MTTNLLKYARYIPRLLSKKRAFPLYIIHFVTQNCNAACSHCLLGQRTGSPGELTLDEIERVSRSIPNFLFCLLTGGEPFLRDDLAEIVDIYSRNNGIVRCLVPSNGSLTEKTMKVVQTILERNKLLSFGVDISIDGIDEEHDKVRQTPGLFKHAVATYKALEDYCRHYRNFDLAATITFSASNQDRVLETYDYLAHSLGVRNIGIRYIRGNPRDPKTLDVDLNKYIALTQRLEEDLGTPRATGFSGFSLSQLITAEQVVAHRYVARTVQEKRWYFPCYAGSLTGVISSNGEVYPCELLDQSFGNLKAHDYDFRKIWRSPRADALRNTIRSEKCFCTHENFYAANLLFNPVQLLKVIRAWAGIRVKKTQNDGCDSCKMNTPK
jgi:radical SAM protein with 4Fe4S-binding SPASM domain